MGYDYRTPRTEPGASAPIDRLEARRQWIRHGDVAAFFGESEAERHAHEIARVESSRRWKVRAFLVWRVRALDSHALIQAVPEELIDGVTKPRGVEEGSRSLLLESQRLFCSRSRPRDAGERDVAPERLGRAPGELATGQRGAAERRGCQEVRRDRLVLPVVVHERLERPRVLLRVSPAALLPRLDQPAHDRADRRGIVAGVSHERAERDRRAADVRRQSWQPAR